MARDLVVRIVGDSRSLEKSFARSEKSAKSFNTSMGRMSRGTVAASGAFASMGRSIAFASGSFLGAAGLTASIKSSVTAAIDLEQQVGKVNVVFGESSKEVKNWSKNLAASFGLSQREALTTAGSFGALFAPIGLVGDAAAEQSQQLTELGADLASFYGGEVTPALEAIRSGLVGESEPLRQYGVRLSEVRVQEKALIETGKENVKQLTELEKTHARIAIIMDDSALAQGDFARTSKTAANQIKTLDANVEDLKANLGAGLVPVVNTTVISLNRLFTATKRLTSADGLPNLRTAADVQKFLAERKRLANLPKFPEPFTGRGEIELREAVAARKAKEAAKKAAEVARETARRVRAAAEAARQEVQERAAFAVERAAATAGLADDLAALNKYNALLARRIRGGHATLELERQQFQVQQEIADVLKQQAEKRAEQRETRQFRILGFGPGGADLVPTAATLRKQLGKAEQALQGTFLDTKKTRSLVARIRKVLSGAMGAISEDVRRRIQELIDDLRGMQEKSRIDLDRWQTAGRGQFVFAATGASRPINVNVQIDGKTVARATAQHNENELGKRHKQRSHSRRTR